MCRRIYMKCRIILRFNFTLALAYCVAEYHASVRVKSAHWKKVNVHLNRAVFVVEGTERSTQFEGFFFNIGSSEFIQTSLNRINDAELKLFF